VTDASLLSRIAETADLLTDPRPHVERSKVWDSNRNAKWRVHKTVQPGLLAQLYESVIPGRGELDSRGKPGSRPPLALEALSAHTVITIAVTRWCWSLHLDLRDTPESNIRALVGAAAILDDDTARTLYTEMRTWRRTCAVLTGWEQLWQPDKIPCPVVDCGTLNSLRVNLTTQTALCVACRASWDADDGTIGILADYISRYADKEAAA
jgi:hypothetical protein